MGLFDAIFGKAKPPHGEPQGSFATFEAYKPAFYSRAGGIYESELIRAAIHARASHISKLRVEIIGSACPTLQTKLRLQPNEFMTWSQFLYRVSTILDVQTTAFIVPIRDTLGRTTGIYPVLPTSCEVKQYAGRPYLSYEFSGGKRASIELEFCAVLTKFQYASDFFGAGNSALDPTLDLVSLSNQGIQEAIKSSASFRFMAQVDNFAKSSDVVKERDRFVEENFKGKRGGMILFPNTYKNLQQVSSKPYSVDAEQLKVIQGNVFNYFGVNEDVLQNKAYGDSMDAFFAGGIEPFAISLSDALTKMLFTEKERGNGNNIAVTSNRLQYMSMKDKIEYATSMGDRGAILIDEMRELFDKTPLPDGKGQVAPIRGEYYNAINTIKSKETTEE